MALFERMSRSCEFERNCYVQSYGTMVGIEAGVTGTEKAGRRIEGTDHTVYYH
jgi:hypothetical protein